MSHQKTRDLSIDVIKGAGCMGMVIAHFAVDTGIAIVPALIKHLGGLAAVLFMAAAAITASFQSQRYSPPSMVKYSLWLFGLGYSWAFIIHGVNAFQFIEIIQIIALGTLLICVLEYRGDCPQSVLLAVAVSLAGLKLVFDYALPQFDGGGLLLTSNDYVPHTVVTQEKVMRFPGFPVLPWLAFFPLGLFCYRASRSLNGAGMLVSLAATLGLVYLGQSPVEKWDMSAAYMASSFMLVFAAFWFVEGRETATGRVSNMLATIGENVILFFYLHPVALVVGALLYKATDMYIPGLIVAVVGAIFVVYWAAKVKPSERFKQPAYWYALLGALFIAPVLSLLWPNNILLVLTRVDALVVGVIFAFNIRQLGTIVKSRKILPTAAS